MSRLLGIAIFVAMFVFFLAVGGTSFLIGFGVAIVLAALTLFAMFLIMGGI